MGLAYPDLIVRGRVGLPGGSGGLKTGIPYPMAPGSLSASTRGKNQREFTILSVVYDLY